MCCADIFFSTCALVPLAFCDIILNRTRSLLYPWRWVRVPCSKVIGPSSTLALLPAVGRYLSMNLCKRPESFLLKVWWWAWVKIRIKGFQLKEVAFDLQLIHHCNLFQGERDQKKIFPPPNDACAFSPYIFFAYILFKRVSFFLRHQSTTLSFRNPFSLFLIFFFVPIFFFLFLACV